MARWLNRSRHLRYLSFAMLLWILSTALMMSSMSDLVPNLVLLFKLLHQRDSLQ
ncbi:MAG: hypothetical protein ACOX19_09210 [Fermentimonas sp.]